MVEVDYGKLAYVKNVELERRIKELEQKLSEFTYKEIELKYVNQAGENTFNKEFKVEVFKEDKYALNVSLYVRANDILNANAEIYVNGIKRHLKSVQVKQNVSYSFDCALEKGTNIIEIKVVSDLETPILESAKILINGAIDYANVKNHISYIDDVNVTFILHLNENKAVLYKYSADGFWAKKIFYDVSDCKICGSKNKVVYICYVDGNKRLKTCVYNDATQEDATYDLGVEGVSSVAGVPYGDGFKIYFSRLAKIYCGEYVEGQAFNPLYTGRKGLEVYADPFVPTAFIIVDNLLNAKLVTV